jgi:hypothetical protein
LTWRRRAVVIRLFAMSDSIVKIEALLRALADVIGFAAGMHEDLYGPSSDDGMEHHRALLRQNPDPGAFLVYRRTTDTDAEAFERALRVRSEDKMPEMGPTEDVWSTRNALSSGVCCVTGRVQMPGSKREAFVTDDGALLYHGEWHRDLKTVKKRVRILLRRRHKQMRHEQMLLERIAIGLQGGVIPLVKSKTKAIVLKPCAKDLESKGAT